jgi:plasmid maintenance system antidote protein VapI
VLQELLDARGMKVIELADITGASRGHLSRVIRRDGKRVSGDLAGRIAVALGLPQDFFVEYREAVVLEAIRKDGRLRERLYKSLSKAARRDDG